MKRTMICVALLSAVAAIGILYAQEDQPSLRGNLVGPGAFDAELLKTFRVTAYPTYPKPGEPGVIECDATLNQSGAYTVKGLNGRHRLHFELEGWIGWIKEVNLPLKEATEVKLRPAGRVAIALDYERMEPRPVSAWINIQRIDGVYSDFTYERQSVTPFRFGPEFTTLGRQFPAGKLDMTLQLSEEIIEFPALQEVELKQGETKQVRFKCRAESRLSVFETGGRSLSGLDWKLWYGDVATKVRPHSSGPGDAHFGRLEEGECRLVVERPGYEPVSVPVTLKYGVRTRVVVTLKPLPENFATGKVLDHEGNPLPGALVRVNPKDAGVLTGADGRFVYPEPGAVVEKFDLYSMAPGHEYGETVPDTKGEWNFQMAKAPSVHGTIKGAEGMCVPLTLYQANKDGSIDLRGQRIEGYSRPDGSYMLTHRKRIDRKVRYDFTERAILVAQVGSVKLEHTFEGFGGDKWLQHDLELPEAGTVRGTVTGADGKPLAGATLQLKTTKSPSPLTATTSDDGSYRFCGLPADSYDMDFPSAMHTYAAPVAPIRLKAGESHTRDIDMSRGCRVLFRATHKGEPLVGVRVLDRPEGRLYASAYRYLHAPPPEPVEFSVTGLLPGKYTLELRGWVMVVGTASLTVPEGTREMLIENDFGNESLSGRLVLPQGADPKLLAQASLRVVSAPKHPYPEITVDETGRFEVKELQPGKYRVLAQAPGFASKPVDFEYADSLSLEIALAPAATLVLVPTSWSSPVDKERLNVTLKGEESFDGRPLRLFIADVPLAGAKGVEASSSIPPGRYTIELAWPAGKFKAETDYFKIDAVKADLAAGKPHEVKFEVRACAAVVLTDKSGVLRSSDVKFYDDQGKVVGEFETTQGRGAGKTMRYSQLPAGKLRIEVTARGHKKHEAEVSTTIGKPAELTIELEKE